MAYKLKKSKPRSDWKQTGKYYWRNKKNDKLIQLGIRLNDGRYTIMLYDKGNHKELEFFNTKTKAIAFIKSYIRKK